MLDVDFVFRRPDIDGPGESIRQYVAPASLVFYNVYDIDIELEMEADSLEIIDVTVDYLAENIRAVEPNNKPRWTLHCRQGGITMLARRFTLQLRSAPEVWTNEIDVRGRRPFHYTELIDPNAD